MSCFVAYPRSGNNSRRQVPDERARIHPAQFIFGHAEGHDRRIFSAQPLVAELFIERHVAVSVDGTDHRRPATGGKFLNLPADGLIVLVMEGGVLFFDVRGRHFLRQQHGPQNLVGGARIHVVRA